MKMNLYVWEDVLVDYTAGMIVALAPTVEAARKAVLEKEPLVGRDVDGEPQVYDMKQPVGFVCWGGG